MAADCVCGYGEHGVGTVGVEGVGGCEADGVGVVECAAVGEDFAGVVEVVG